MDRRREGGDEGERPGAQGLGAPQPEDERAEGERDVRAKIAEMPSPDREMGERIHELVLASVPELAPKTYYGMPAYAMNGKTICFFKPASKFKVRYATSSSSRTRGWTTATCGRSRSPSRS